MKVTIGTKQLDFLHSQFSPVNEPIPRLPLLERQSNAQTTTVQRTAFFADVIFLTTEDNLVVGSHTYCPVKTSSIHVKDSIDSANSD